MTNAGTVGNQVIIEDGLATIGQASVYELAAMDQWLSAIDADTLAPTAVGQGVGPTGRTRSLTGASSTTARWCTRRCPTTGSGQCARAAFPGGLEHPVDGRRVAVHAGPQVRVAATAFSDYPVDVHRCRGKKAELRGRVSRPACATTRVADRASRKPVGTWLTYGG